MDPLLIGLAVLIVAAAYAWHQYQNAQAKQRAAGQWNTVIKIGAGLL